MTDKELLEERIVDDRLNHIDHENAMECMINGKYFIVTQEGPSMCRIEDTTLYYIPGAFGVYAVSEGLVERRDKFDMDYVWGHYAIRWLIRAVESDDYYLEPFNNGWRIQYIATQPNKDSVDRFEIMLDSDYKPISANFQLVDGTVMNLSILRFGDYTVELPEILTGDLYTLSLTEKMRF